jgi:hypothetical protein
MNELEAYRQTVEHIRIAQRLLLSAQVELSRRAVTHDQSKLESPEWEVFRDVTHTLKGLTYGSGEYKAQLEQMRTEGALAHHYEHNRHHPEYFEQRKPSKEIENHLTMAKWAVDSAQVLPDDIYGYRNLKGFLENQQAQHQSSINNMNLFDLLEMMVDWMAATQRHADGDIEKSIEINQERFSMSPQLVEIFKNTVLWIKDEFDGLHTQKDIEP